MKLANGSGFPTHSAESTTIRSESPMIYPVSANELVEKLNTGINSAAIETVAAISSPIFNLFLPTEGRQNQSRQSTAASTTKVMIGGTSNTPKQPQEVSLAATLKAVAKKKQIKMQMDTIRASEDLQLEMSQNASKTSATISVAVIPRDSKIKFSR